MIRFGPGGNSTDFYDKGYKNSEKAPKYLKEMGLSAYEYECSRGINVSDKKCELIRINALENDIAISVHSPFFISLSTVDEQKQKNTIKYITDSMEVCKKMGGNMVVVHSGATLGMEREEAMNNACILLKRAIDEADKLGLSDVHICPETMGKINQLGDTKEVIRLCKIDDRLIPTIDFGHLYCRNFGKLNTKEGWLKELQEYIDELGYERMKHFHAHFSKMIFTIPGGEKEHVTFIEDNVGPDFENVAYALKKLKLEPTIICESSGTQSIDALKMKNIYDNITL